MSYDLVFWRGTSSLPPVDVYRRLAREQQVEGLESVSADRVMASLATHLADWDRTVQDWVYRADADGNGPAMDLYIGAQWVSASCYGLPPDAKNAIMDAMFDLGLRLYDPQIDELFAAP